MAPPFLNVRPGDLIRADFMNDILNYLNSLEYRVEQLEKGQTGQPPLQGAIDVAYQDVSPNPITVGSTANIHYQLRSRANATAACTIVPQISGGTGVSWQVGVLLQNSDGSKTALQAPYTIRLDPGQKADFFVQVGSVPGGVPKFTLGVTVTASNLANSDGPRDFPVGSAAPQQDPNITAGQPVVQSGGSIDPTSNTLKVAAGAKAVVSITYSLTLKAGTTPPVNYTITQPTANSGWQADYDLLSNIRTAFTLQASDFSGATNTATRILTLDIAPGAGATATGASAQIQIQQQGASASRTVTIPLALA